jgi:hypothetical protein
VPQCVASNGDCSSPAAGNGAVAGATPSAGGTITGLSAGTTYKCFVLAFNTNADNTKNTVCQTAGQSFTTVPVYPPNPPTNPLVSTTPAAAVPNARDAAFSWTNSAVDATHDAAVDYEVRCFASPGNACGQVFSAFRLPAAAFQSLPPGPKIAQDASGTTTYTTTWSDQFLIANGPLVCYIVPYNAAASVVIFGGECSAAIVLV